MALTATLWCFGIALSDADRGVYESLELRTAQYPFKADRYGDGEAERGAAHRESLRLLRSSCSPTRSTERGLLVRVEPARQLGALAVLEAARQDARHASVPVIRRMEDRPDRGLRGRP